MCDLLGSGALGAGASAKVSPAAETRHKTHLICVYVQDCRDTEALLKVLAVLLSAMGDHPSLKGLAFKRDQDTVVDQPPMFRHGAISLQHNRTFIPFISRQAAVEGEGEGDGKASTKVYVAEYNLGPRFASGLVATMEAQAAPPDAAQAEVWRVRILDSAIGRGGAPICRQCSAHGEAHGPQCPAQAQARGGGAQGGRKA